MWTRSGTGPQKPPREGSRLTDLWLQPSSRVFSGTRIFPKHGGFRKWHGVPRQPRPLATSTGLSFSGGCPLRPNGPSASHPYGTHLAAPASEAEVRVPGRRRAMPSGRRSAPPPAALRPSAASPAAPCAPRRLPRLTTGRGRPPIKSKGNLFGPDTDLLKK